MRELPGGTLTVLHTDVEASTPLTMKLKDRYPAVLATHQALLRASFAAHEGHEVDTQGDSFFVVFPRATQAVAAAVASQRALAAEVWPDDGILRVRIGMHTGEPIRTAHGYAGLDVIRGRPHQGGRAWRAGAALPVDRHLDRGRPHRRRSRSPSSARNLLGMAVKR